MISKEDVKQKLRGGGESVTELVGIITSGCRGREDPSPSGEGMNRAPPLCRKL